MVVVQRQQTNVVKPSETVVVDTTDFVVPQHPTNTPKAFKYPFSMDFKVFGFTWLLSLTAFVILRGLGTSRFEPNRFDWL